MLGVIKLTVILDVNNHKIAIFSTYLCAETTPICSDFVDRTPAKKLKSEDKILEIQLHLVREVQTAWPIKMKFYVEHPLVGATKV